MIAVLVSIIPVIVCAHQPYLLLENIDHFTQMFGKDIAFRYVGHRVYVLVLVGELDIYTAKKSYGQRHGNIQNGTTARTSCSG